MVIIRMNHIWKLSVKMSSMLFVKVLPLSYWLDFFDFPADIATYDENCFSLI